MTDKTAKGRSQTARIYDIRKQGVEVRRNWAMFVAQSGHAGHYAVYSVQKTGIVALENEATKEAREFWGQLEKDGVTISPSALDAEERAIDLFG